MKAIARFFLSLKTAFWLFFVFIVFAFIGSVVLPNNLAFFSGIDDTPLFRWLSDSGNLKLTWWIYAMILMLALLAVSTIFCTIDGTIKGLNSRNLILKLSPQVMHLGVLFIMLGHLLTASIGFKTDMRIKEGEKKVVAGEIELYLEDVKVQTDKQGYYTDWEAKLWWFENGEKVKEEVLRPVHPLYFGQFGLYFKSVSIEPEPSALIRVCRDPGALWALIGGVFLSIGGLGFVYGRFSA
jgi:cytochrome c biogenesis factor